MVFAKARKIHRSPVVTGHGGRGDRQIEEFRKEIEGFRKEAQRREEEIRAEIGKIREEGKGRQSGQRKRVR